MWERFVTYMDGRPRTTRRWVAWWALALATVSNILGWYHWPHF